MTRTLIIQPHPATFAPHVASVHFHVPSRPVQAVRSMPAYYSVVARADGSVTRAEYQSKAQLLAHRSRIASMLAFAHVTSPVLGCHCKACA